MTTDSGKTQARPAPPPPKCTCHWPPYRYAGPGFGLDPDCPRHGTEACLELADQELDIDTSHQREEPT